MLLDVETFRVEAREWLREHMPRLRPDADARYGNSRTPEDFVARSRELQRILFDGGFAGICYPTEFGGRGLSIAHQHTFNDEALGYEMPIFCNIPTLSIVGPTLLEFGTEDQKSRHVPAILRGDELWVQFLSEPTGGSDLAGAVTTAVRDGDLFRISGSKIWSSGAQWCDYGLLLARTDWDRPKHQGLSVFVVGAHAPGVVVQPIKQVNGSTEFCQEFFDDVEVSADDLVGRVNDGWNVASRILAHERSALGGSSPYVSGAAAGPVRSLRMNYLDLARAAEKQHDAHVRQLVGEAYAIGRVQEALIARVSARIAAGELAPTAGSLLKLSSAVNGIRWVDIANEILGPAAVVWQSGSTTGDFGTQYLRRQAAALGGGSSEMQRNMISERLLGMPRDRGEGANLPFREVRSNQVRSASSERPS